MMALAMTGCGAKTEQTGTGAITDTPRVLRYGFVDGGGTGIPTGIIGIAKEQGYFDEELAKVNATIDLSGFRNAGPGINAAIASKSIDMGGLGDIPALVAKASGVDTVLIGGSLTDTDTYLVVQNGTDYKDITDLAGKSIATQIGAYMQRTLYLFLEDKGMSIADVDFINMTGTDAANALAAKSIDATVISATSALKLVDEGLARIIGSTEGHPEWLNASGTVVDATYAKANPDVVEAFLRALIRAKEFGDADPAYIRNQLIAVGNPEKIIDLVYPDLQFNTNFEATDNVRASLQSIAQFMVDNDLASELVDVEAWYDGSYLERARASLK
jgi:aliphatic sulfonates family ABC transporter substrate-binding protein